MLQVVGAGVGRTGTHSLKIALEQLLGGTCHHMMEVIVRPEEVPTWTDAIDGKEIDWNALMEPYTAQVDWPGASFWPELSKANPDALVILSVRDPDDWYTSCTNTIFEGIEMMIEQGNDWMSAVHVGRLREAQRRRARRRSVRASARVERGRRLGAPLRTPRGARPH
jgi:hypothetical protein